MLYLASHRMPSRLVGDSENSGWQLVGSEPRRFLTTANHLRNTLQIFLLGADPLFSYCYVGEIVEIVCSCLFDNVNLH